MRAFVVDNFGEPGAIRDMPEPEPGAGEVRIRVGAAGVNPVDVAVISGYMRDFMEHRLPLIPGIDASGVVDALGDGVDAWSAGDEIFGAVGKMYFGEGTYAESATLSAATIARRPASLDHAGAATMPTPGISAVTILDALSLGDGESLLAVGASGGIGSFLVQLARHRGARVIAVCHGDNSDYVRGLGADDVIDHTAGDVADQLRRRVPDGVDAIADMFGDKESLARLSAQLRPGGRVASASGAADVEALSERGFTGANIMTMVTGAKLSRLAELLAAGDPPGAGGGAAAPRAGGRGTHQGCHQAQPRQTGSDDLTIATTTGEPPCRP